MSWCRPGTGSSTTPPRDCHTTPPHLGRDPVMQRKPAVLLTGVLKASEYFWHMVGLPEAGAIQGQFPTSQHHSRTATAAWGSRNSVPDLDSGKEEYPISASLPFLVPWNNNLNALCSFPEGITIAIFLIQKIIRVLSFPFLM